MKTWTQFLEAKHNEANAQLAPMSQQPVTAGTRPSARRSATLSLTPAQRIQGQQAYQAAGQPQSQVVPVSDEEMGEPYSRSMKIQQDMAKAQMGRRV